MENKSITHQKETAGKIMTKNVPVVGIEENIARVEKVLIEKSGFFDSINYVYVVNERGKLAGVISVKEIFRQKNEVKIKDIMITDLIVVRAGTDQERVVYKALEHNIKAVPVVDKFGYFLGVVPSDDILRVLYRETQEDFFQMAGIINPRGNLDSVMSIPAYKSFLRRFPWIFIGLFGGVFMARIIGVFEEEISRNVILAFFIPLVVYVASAVSNQMSTFIIRDLAINNINFLKYFLKNFFVAILMALASSFSFFIINLIIYSNNEMGLIISVAIFFTILSALFTGLLVPFALSKLKTDPANASGPFGTIIQDILSVLIYFSIISLMI